MQKKLRLKIISNKLGIDSPQSPLGCKADCSVPTMKGYWRVEKAMINILVRCRRILRIRSMITSHNDWASLPLSNSHLYLKRYPLFRTPRVASSSSPQSLLTSPSSAAFCFIKTSIHFTLVLNSRISLATSAGTSDADAIASTPFGIQQLFTILHFKESASSVVMYPAQQWYDRYRRQTDFQYFITSKFPLALLLKFREIEFYFWNSLRFPDFRAWLPDFFSVL